MPGEGGWGGVGLWDTDITYCRTQESSGNTVYWDDC